MVIEFEISKKIQLKSFSLDQADVFFDSIHELKDSEDPYRERLQEKHETVSKTEAIIVDAVDNKYKIDGTPDFFIYFDNQIAGVFEFAPLQEDVDFVEVGYWLFRKYRRNGVLSTVFPSMIKFAHDHFDRLRLIATTPLDNYPSQKLLEKVGFSNTGRVEEFKKENGILEKDVEYELILKGD